MYFRYVINKWIQILCYVPELISIGVVPGSLHGPCLPNGVCSDSRLVCGTAGLCLCGPSYYYKDDACGEYAHIYVYMNHLSSGWKFEPAQDINISIVTKKHFLEILKRWLQNWYWNWIDIEKILPRCCQLTISRQFPVSKGIHLIFWKVGKRWFSGWMNKWMNDRLSLFTYVNECHSTAY